MPGGLEGGWEPGGMVVVFTVVLLLVEWDELVMLRLVERRRMGMCRVCVG